MTDTSLLATTPSTGDPYPVTAPPHSPVPNGAVSDSVPFEDEEPYTIKCICAFQDDDGNTVFCEKCETWQHIECYYHGKEVPDEHFCTDCSPSPRYMDGKRATERQRRLREQSDGGDRKVKRSTAKTQKKKQKEHDLVNGTHVRSDSSSRDQPNVGKKKPSHKPSASITSVSAPPKLVPESRKRSGSVIASVSPTKPSGPQIPLYSNEFLHLYDDDRGHVNMKSNLVVNLHLLGDMGSWVKDPSSLPRVGTGRSPQDTFTYSDSLDSSQWPELSIKTILDDDLDVDGIRPKWKALKTENIVHKDQIVGEIKGKIGQLRDYCLDPSNQWPELRHPQPFVFFHPQLPIYIDTREEGSILRYVRRSCRPNVTMKTFITNEVEYHFCFVANQDIAAGSEITAMWYLDPQLFGSNNLGKQESGDHDQEEARAIAMSNVLAHFGGCACSPSQACLLAAVDRRRHPSVKQINGKRKKTKSKSTVSPTSGGRSNTSRAGSEAVNDDDNADNRSTSGSARGQARSRDLTPTNPPPDWALPDSELSARDRRKIAAVEKKFEQLEHDQQGGQRKKKRGSAQSGQPTPLANSSKQLNHVSTPSQSKSLKVDPTRQSNSPPHLGSRQHVSPQSAVSGSKRSPLSRSSYVDGSQQTLTRIDFSPLSRRLLKRCHEDSLKSQWPVKRQEHAASSALDVAISPTASESQHLPHSPNETDDVEMVDVGNDETPPKSRPSNRLDSPDVISKPPLPSPLPSTLAHNTPIPGMPLNKERSSSLHVQLPPNNFALPATNPPPGSATPSSLQSPSDSLTQPPQTPGGSITAPSPVKKKMSLGDYLGRRGTMATPTSEKTQAQANSNLAPPSKPTHQLQSTTPPLSTDGEPQNLPTGNEGPKSEDLPNSEAVANADADVPMKDVSNKPPISPPYVPPPSSLGMQNDNTKVSPT